MSTVAPAAGPDAAAHLESLGLTDPARYYTVPCHPIMDLHEPIKKRVRDPAEATDDNPEGIVEKMMECDEDDLATAAENSNKLVAIGRPPRIQIGHAPLDKDKPESFLPKPVGLMSNFVVCPRDGVPWLCADLHYRREHAAEAMTYPNISPERVNWSDPSKHAVKALAMLRRDPERPVPFAPYHADPATLEQLVCYGRDHDGPLEDLTPEEPPPPPERKAMSLEPEDVIKIQESFVSTVTPLFESMTTSLIAALKPPAPEAPAVPETSLTAAPAAPEATNYAAGMAPAGPNTGYVPTDEETANMARACYAAAKEVPILAGKVSALVSEVDTLKAENLTFKAENATLKATVAELDESHQLARAETQRANYERMIDDAVAVGTIIDAPGRESLLKMVYKLDESERTDAIKSQLALYNKSSIGQPLIPGAVTKAPVESPDRARRRVQWATENAIFNPAEARRKFDILESQGLV